MVIKKGSREFSSHRSARSFSFASLAQAIHEKKPSGDSRVRKTPKQLWKFPIITCTSLNSLSLPTGNSALVPKQEELTNNNNRPSPSVPPYSIPGESSPKDDDEDHPRHAQTKTSTGRGCTIQADLRKCFHIPPAKGNNRHHRRPRCVVQQRNASLMGSASKRLARRVEAFQRQCVRKMEKTLNRIGFMGTNNNQHKKNNNQKTRLDLILRSLQQPRFKRGQFVLVCNIPSAIVTTSHCPTIPTNTSSAPPSLSLNTRNLVNRHGYPRDGGGGGTSLDEQQGPYLYVLAEIRQVHCGDGLGWVQYTIVRADTGEESWLDEVFMEPILSEHGRLAALKAARLLLQQQNPEDEATQPSNKDTGARATMDEINEKCKTE